MSIPSSPSSRMRNVLYWTKRALAAAVLISANVFFLSAAVEKGTVDNPTPETETAAMVNVALAVVPYAIMVWALFRRRMLGKFGIVLGWAMLLAPLVLLAKSPLVQNGGLNQLTGGNGMLNLMAGTLAVLGMVLLVSWRTRPRADSSGTVPPKRWVYRRSMWLVPVLVGWVTIFALGWILPQEISSVAGLKGPDPVWHRFAILLALAAALIMRLVDCNFVMEHPGTIEGTRILELLNVSGWIVRERKELQR